MLNREACLCLLQEPDDLRQDGGTISSRYRAITQRLNADDTERLRSGRNDALHELTRKLLENDPTAEP